MNLAVRDKWEEGNSVGIYQNMDKESIAGIVIKQGITKSWTRNPPEEWVSAGNYQLMTVGSTEGKDKWDSAWNYQVMDEESTGGMGFCQKLPAHERGIHWRNGIPNK
jgi:hypothetical protein